VITPGWSATFPLQDLVRVARQSGVIDNPPDLMRGHISGSSTRTGDAVRALPTAARENPRSAALPRGSDQLIAKETSRADRLSRQTGGKKGVALN